MQHLKRLLAHAPRFIYEILTRHRLQAFHTLRVLRFQLVVPGLLSRTPRQQQPRAQEPEEFHVGSLRIMAVSYPAIMALANHPTASCLSKPGYCLQNSSAHTMASMVCGHACLRA